MVDANIFDETTENVFVHFRGTDGSLLWDDDQEVGVWILSIDSDAYKEIQDNIFRRLNKLKNPPKSVYDRAVIERLARSTVKFQGITMDNKPIEGLKETTEFYTRYRRIREQIFEFIADEDNFLANKPGSYTS